MAFRRSTVRSRSAPPIKSLTIKGLFGFVPIISLLSDIVSYHIATENGVNRDPTASGFGLGALRAGRRPEASLIATGAF
jgi:hypothetical protein